MFDKTTEEMIAELTEMLESFSVLKDENKILHNRIHELEDQLEVPEPMLLKLLRQNPEAEVHSVYCRKTYKMVDGKICISGYMGGFNQSIIGQHLSATDWQVIEKFAPAKHEWLTCGGASAHSKHTNGMCVRFKDWDENHFMRSAVAYSNDGVRLSVEQAYKYAADLLNFGTVGEWYWAYPV